MSYSILHSKYSEIALINVNREDDRLFAGFVYLDRGLPETIAVECPTSKASYTIRIPAPLRQITTHATMTDKGDRIEFQIV
jgi:hypothetical protein